MNQQRQLAKNWHTQMEKKKDKIAKDIKRKMKEADEWQLRMKEYGELLKTEIQLKEFNERFYKRDIVLSFIEEGSGESVVSHNQYIINTLLEQITEMNTRRIEELEGVLHL